MRPRTTDNEKRSLIRRVVLSVMMVAFFVCIIFVYYQRLYAERRANIISTGRVNSQDSANQINMRLSSSMDILKLASYTLDNMLRDDRSQKEILDYMTDETVAVGDSLIADTTGIYGYIRGQYMDGSGWVPEEGYDPTKRPWYLEAKAGNGRLVIVDPYVDLDTGTVMIALAKTLCDAKSVVGIDISMADLQSITEEHVANDRSCKEFIINNRGLVIAHSDKQLIGTNIVDGVDPLMTEISSRLETLDSNYFYLKHNRKDYMIYAMPLENNWTCVSVIDASDDFDKLRIPLYITILTSFILAASFAFFILRSEKNLREAREAELASEKAVAASDAKSSFLSTMSHEIRTPVNAILGMNEMIARESQDEAILGYSDNIKGASNSLLGIINDILDFSKIEAGKIEIIPVDYDIASLVNDLVNMIQKRADDKNLKLILNIDPQTPRSLFGDEVRVRQVITNILTNAVKYTEKGSVTFTVGYEDIPDDPDNVMLKVSVKDTGIGIKKEDIEKLFSKFERIEEERNRNVEGTGLGMNITKNLLALMGSCLEVESVYGEGSTFSFALKQKRTGDDTVGDYEQSYRAGRADRKKYKEKFTAPSARVLVVDDSPMNLIVFKSLLKRTLVNVDTAKDGNEGIFMSRQKKYDILFLDHMMPGKDGIETLKEIRADEGNPNIETCAISLTANAVSGAREQYLEAGFDDYMTKPIEPARLEQMMLDRLPQDKIESRADDDPAASVLDGIREAADAMDCNRLETVFAGIDEGTIPADRKELIAKLRVLADGYEYEKITELIEGATA